MKTLKDKLTANCGLAKLSEAMSLIKEEAGYCAKGECWTAEDGQNIIKANVALIDFHKSLLTLLDTPCPANGTQLSINDVLYQAYLEFKEKYGHAPKFAHVGLMWDGDDEVSTDWIKLRDFDENDTSNDPDDNNVVFYCRGIQELMEINAYDIADFKVVEFYEFSDTYAPW